MAEEATMKDFIQYCELNDIMKRSELKDAPRHIQLMIAKPEYKA